MRHKSPQSGFFTILAAVIIIIIILALIGYDAEGFWNNILRPIIEFIFNLIIKLFDLVVAILTKAVSVFKNN